MPRPFPLNATKGGIDRQRTEGSPSPDTLYDLLNGYINSAFKMVSRPGSRTVYDLPFEDGEGGYVSYTKGFCVFRGAFVVFSNAPRTVPSGVTCEVLVHPTQPDLALAVIHFSAPFLRYLYVVAEFSNGEVFHYWLQRATTWQADHIYNFGELVEPMVPNGFVYAAERLGDPNPLWTANTARTVGDRVEPTEPTGYYFEVTATVGTSPRSGAIEPDWNNADGAITYEDVDTGTAPTTPTGPTGPVSGPGTDTTDRYENPAGTRPPSTIER